MPSRSHLVAALFAALVATGAGAQMRTASIGVSATVIASCRIEMPGAHVESPGAALPTARITCPGSSRPATRAVVERGVPKPAPAVWKQAMTTMDGASETDAGFRWVRLDVEY